MFFLIGGVQPRTRELDSHPGTCANCGRAGLRLKRTDHYLSLFFIPLFPVKKGTPFLECGGCRAVYAEDGSPPGRGVYVSLENCPRCGRSVQPDFSICPYCGQALKSIQRR